MERPVWEMLENNRGRLSFHMPGHKGRGPFGPLDAYALDTTELPGTDDLYCPENGLREAQERYARAAGSGAALFLHNGSTAGIQAMLMLYAYPGDTVLLPRNAHLSAVNGCIVGDLRPAFMPLSFTEDGYGYLREETALAALAAHPQARCLLVTSPDYYGGRLPLERIAAAAHAQGCRLVVDEAHGAHFPWLDGARGAAACGADAWVQSCHKTLPSLTGTAVLHLRDVEDNARALRLLRMTQTSSPNYVLMMSVDDARAYMDAEGGVRLKAVSEAAGALRARLPALGYGDAQALWRSTGLTFDPTRLVILAPQGGEALDRALAARGVDVEMHDIRRVVCILTAMDDRVRLARLEEALGAIAPRRAELPPTAYDQPLPPVVMPPRQAAMGRVARVALDRAAGRVAAASAGLYPPGIPLVAPGEQITEQTVAALAQAGPRRRFGVEGEQLLCVR